jgi:ABC-type bacteriocin/lantibiotic exporter with double-glycine peptidase domain
MDLIHQRGTMDCGIAVAAMFLNITYDEAAYLDPNPTAERGLYVYEFITICQKKGVKMKVKKPHPLPLKNCILPKECALIIRKPNQKFGHYIYYKNNYVYDPELKKKHLISRYKKNWWQVIRIFVKKAETKQLKLL